MEVTREKEREVNWSQWAGVAVIAAGVVILIAGRKK
jgi:drug/metabolite transporter (DMT)-like permease